MFNRRTWKNFDLVLFFTVMLIFSIGLLFLYSATYQFSHPPRGVLFSQNFLFRQLIWFALSLLIGIIIIKVDYQRWLELAYVLYGLNLVLLVLVLLIGKSRLGAQRWISFANIAFQPSEFSKLVIILILARYLGQKKPAFHRHGAGYFIWRYGRTLAAAFLIVCLPFVLIVKQPDLGTALTLVPILVVILYVWGMPLKSLLLISGSCLLTSPFLWHLLKAYQKKRILVFLNPNMDPLGAGYTVIQSKIAIGSGRLFGKGWLAGTQSQLNFLPERHTDFIFSTVAEEWGFAGALLLLALYAVLIWRGYWRLQRTSNLSGRLLVAGIVTMLSFQIVVNISMTMGLLPVVGLPLPLISYGGSSLLTTMIALALLLSVGMRS